MVQDRERERDVIMVSNVQTDANSPPTMKSGSVEAQLVVSWFPSQNDRVQKVGFGVIFFFFPSETKSRL